MSRKRAEYFLGQMEAGADRGEPVFLHRQKSLFEKYVLRDGAHADERAKLWREYQTTGGSLTGSDGLRKSLGAFDLEYFGQAYLPHYFTTTPPEFHAELDNVWFSGVMKGLNPTSSAKEISFSKGCRRAIEAPRGHAKSTNFTFKDALHAAVYGYKHYPIILSDSSEQAEGFLADIRAEIEENSIIREDFGDLRGRVWKSMVLLFSNGVKIEALGAGKKIRGRRHKQWRPDLIICDDLENDENVNTPEQRRKLENWFNKAVSNAGDTYTDIVYIGTLLHYDSLLAKVTRKGEYKSRKYRAVIAFAKNHALWAAWEALYNDLLDENHQETARDFYEANREEMLEGVEVLWENKWDYYSLMVKKLSIGDAAFGSEYQNDPIDPDNCVFNEEQFDFYDDDGKQPRDFSDNRFIFVGANDPSLGKSRKSDTSAIIALALDTQTGYMYVLIADIERRRPDAIIDDAIESSKRLRREFRKPYTKFGVETVQFQEYFKDIMAQRSAQTGEYLPIEPIGSVRSKDVRIQSLQPFVKNGYLKFSKKHKTLLKQMAEYPMGANDDGPDGLEMAVSLAQTIKISRAADYRSVISRMLRFKSGAY